MWPLKGQTYTDFYYFHAPGKYKQPFRFKLSLTF